MPSFIELMKATEDRALNPYFRKHLEAILIQLVKKGWKFPPSDEIFKMTKKLSGEPQDTGFYGDEKEFVICMLEGLHNLYALTILNERM